jgi:hypothetical protein
MAARIHMEKALRRSAHHDDFGKVEKGGKRRGVPSA